MKMRSDSRATKPLATNKLINRKAIDFSLMENETLRKNNKINKNNIRPV